MNIVFLFVCVCVCKASFFFCFLKILRIKTLNYQFFLSIVIKSLTDFLYEFSITIFIFFFSYNLSNLPTIGFVIRQYSKMYIVEKVRFAIIFYQRERNVSQDFSHKETNRNLSRT